MKDPKTKRFEEMVMFILDKENITQKALAEKIGYAIASISRSINGKDPLTRKMVEKFKNIYPNLNEEYIFKGTGSMFLADKAHRAQQSNEKIESAISKQLPIFNLEEQNLSLKLFTGKNKVNPSGYVSFPGSEFCDFAVYVLNDAMEEFPKGSIVTLKRISDLNIIEYGESFLIHTKDIVLHRNIHQDKANHSKLILSATNPKYDDWTIDRNKIIDVYHISKNIK